jgi:hypothetical protein
LAGSAITAIVIAGLLTACGGGSSSKTISKAEFITRADAICSAGTKRITALPSPRFDPATATKRQLPQISRYLPHLIGELQFEHNAIGGLPSPGADKSIITRTLAHLQRYIALLTSEQRAAAAGDLSRFQALLARESQPSSPLAQADRLAKQFGLKICGQGPA